MQNLSKNILFGVAVADALGVFLTLKYKQTRKSYDALFKRQTAELAKDRKNKSELASLLRIFVERLFLVCKH